MLMPNDCTKKIMSGIKSVWRMAPICTHTYTAGSWLLEDTICQL